VAKPKGILIRVGLSAVILFGCPAVLAQEIDNTRSQFKGKSNTGLNPGTPDGREGGEIIESAFPIPALPFVDTGNTCDNLDNFEELCPYYSNSPLHHNVCPKRLVLRW